MGYKMQVAVFVLALAIVPNQVTGQFNLYYGYTRQELEEFIAKTVSLKTLIVLEKVDFSGKGAGSGGDDG